MSGRTNSCMPFIPNFPAVIIIDDDSQQQPEKNTPTMLESFGLTRCDSLVEAPRKRSRSEEEEEEGEVSPPVTTDTLTNLKPKRLVYDDIRDDEDDFVPMTQPVPVDDTTVTTSNAATELEEGEILDFAN
jgi:hypothetical protein